MNAVAVPTVALTSTSVPAPTQKREAKTDGETPNKGLGIISKMEKKQCPHCPKSFKNVQEHITKMHSHYRFVCDDNNEIAVFRNDVLITTKLRESGTGWIENDDPYILYQNNDDYEAWVNVETFEIKLYKLKFGLDTSENIEVFMKSQIVEMTEKFKQSLKEDKPP